MKEFRMTFNDYLNAQYLFLGWKRWILQLSIIFVIFYLMINEQVSHYSFLFISFILVLIAVFLVPSLYTKRFWKMYKSQTPFQINISVKFNENFVEWITDSGSDKIYWKDIYKFKTNNKIIIILSSANIMHPIPRSAFDDNEELNHFLKLLNSTKN